MLCLGCGIVLVHPSADELLDRETAGLGILPVGGACVAA